MSLMSNLSKPAFWIGVIVVIIALRATEAFVPAVKMVTRPGARTATSGG